jgi:hypothetical protein
MRHQHEHQNTPPNLAGHTGRKWRLQIFSVTRETSSASWHSQASQSCACAWMWCLARSSRGLCTKSPDSRLSLLLMSRVPFYIRHPKTETYLRCSTTRAELVLEEPQVFGLPKSSKPRKMRTCITLNSRLPLTACLIFIGTRRMRTMLIILPICRPLKSYIITREIPMLRYIVCDKENAATEAQYSVGI